MRGLRGRRSGEVLFGSAGWLFADLMLALVMMFVLAAVISAPKPAPKPHPAAAAPTTTTTPPVTKPTARPPRLLPDPIKRDVHMNTDALLRNDRGAIAAMRANMRRFASARLGKRRAGIVLTFGSASSADIQRGIHVAGRFNNQVLHAIGGQFAGAAYRSYFQGGGDPNKITFEIFVFDS